LYTNNLNLLGDSSEGQNGLPPFNLSFCNGDTQVQRESSVKDLTHKLTNLRSPDESPVKLAPPLDDMKGIISKAMEGNFNDGFTTYYVEYYAFIIN